MQVHGAGVAHVLAAPDALVDGLAEEGDVAVADKEQQQLELLGRQRDGARAARHGVGAGVYRQPADAYLGYRLPRAPEHGLHPREQLHYLKRLDKIVVRAQAQALHLVGHGALRCEKYHGNAQRLYEIQQLVAADLRQHDVQQHEVEALLLQQVRRLQPVVGADAGISRLREVHLDKIVDGPLVLHDKYPVHAVHLRPIQYNTNASNLHHTRLFQEKSRKNLLQIFRARFGMFCGYRG